MARGTDADRPLGNELVDVRSFIARTGLCFFRSRNGLGQCFILLLEFLELLLLRPFKLPLLFQLLLGAPPLRSRAHEVDAAPVGGYCTQC